MTMPRDMRTRQRIAWGLSTLATAIWAAVVGAAGLFGRVADHWEAAATMLFGSFLAGSSPEGGGAIAFPVFTKLLHVPAPIARTFRLSIQAVGMTMAVIAVVLFVSHHSRPGGTRWFGGGFRRFRALRPGVRGPERRLLAGVDRHRVDQGNAAAGSSGSYLNSTASDHPPEGGESARSFCGSDQRADRDVKALLQNLESPSRI